MKGGARNGHNSSFAESPPKGLKMTSSSKATAGMGKLLSSSVAAVQTERAMVGTGHVSNVIGSLVTQKVVLLFLMLLIIMPWIEVKPTESAAFVSLEQVYSAHSTALRLAGERLSDNATATAAGAKIVSESIVNYYTAGNSLLYLRLGSDVFVNERHLIGPVFRTGEKLQTPRS